MSSKLSSTLVNVSSFIASFLISTFSTVTFGLAHFSSSPDNAVNMHVVIILQ